MLYIYAVLTVILIEKCILNSYLKWAILSLFTKDILFIVLATEPIPNRLAVQFGWHLYVPWLWKVYFSNYLHAPNTKNYFAEIVEVTRMTNYTSVFLNVY